MLLDLRQPLYPLDNLLVVLTLHHDGDGQTTHDEERGDVAILRDSLEVGHVERAGRLMEHIGEVLGHEPIQTFQRIKADDPVIGRLSRLPGGLAEVVRIATVGAVSVPLACKGGRLSTHTSDRTSNNAAPSERSVGDVTGRARSKVAKKERNAASSLRSASDMVVMKSPRAA